jgi:hypothetical protein
VLHPAKITITPARIMVYRSILLMAVPAEALAPGMAVGVTVITEGAVISVPYPMLTAEPAARFMNLRVGAAQAIAVVVASDTTAGLVASGMAGGAGLQIGACFRPMLGFPGQR